MNTINTIIIICYFFHLEYYKIYKIIIVFFISFFIVDVFNNDIYINCEDEKESVLSVQVNINYGRVIIKK